MTELLPIVFQKGVNESIDSRVAPPEVHTVAQNVRWRKDGRPAKRYGSVAVSVAPFAAGVAYDGQAANAITSWNGVPVLAMGGSVRQQNALGWQQAGGGAFSELPHFGPGERDVISRNEGFTVTSASAGTSGTTVLYAWSDGTQVYYALKSTSGATILSPTFLAAGADPRVISTTNYIYVLSKNGATLDLRVIDPASPLSVTVAASPGTLDAATSHYDAFGRGADFLIAYQSTATTVTSKLFTAVLAPVLQNTQAFAGVGVTGAYCGITSVTGGPIFLTTMATNGDVSVLAYNNALSALTGAIGFGPDATNGGQPTVALANATQVDVAWSGFVVASESSFVRSARVDTAGTVVSATATYYNMSLASKLFRGPATSPVDGPFAWVATHNANNGSVKWDSQRAYYLVTLTTGSFRERYAHVPNVAPGVLAQNNLADVLPLGVGYGYLAPLLNALRYGNGLGNMLGVDSVTVRSIYESMRMAARDSAVCGRALQFAGGSLYELNGDLSETCFSNAPVIQSAVGGGGGALTAASTYIYRAVYERIDAQGRRHRSTASDPFAFASGANNSATLTVKRLITSSTGSEVLHIYRTLAGQGTYHRVTPNTGAPAGAPNPVTPTVAYVDLMSDAVAATQEVIYTDGGVADNTLCPPHTFHAVCSGRLWVAGQLDRCVCTASKILVDGEPTQFSDLDSFSVFLPDKCTGIASIDGTVVAFARERIFFITGDGPNDQGVGSFNPPTELPTDVGCIDWRSVLETSLGVFFQSKRGIYLLPRGFNTPVFIGAEVETTLATYPIVLSATLVAQPSSGLNNLGEITARFVVAADETATSSRVLVYDLRTGGWSVDSSAGIRVGLAGSFNDTFVFSTTNGTATALHAESVGTYSDNDGILAIPTSLATGDIRPFGVAGYGRFCSVVLLGEFRSICTVQIDVSVDGATADSFSFSITSADAPDGSVYLDVTPRVATGSALRVTCTDLSAAVGNEGFVMQALFIEHDMIGKTKRLAAARRA